MAWAAAAAAARGMALAVTGTVVEVGSALGAAVVIVVLLAALFGRYRGSKEAQSMAGYRRTLEVLGRLGDGSERRSSRTARGPGAPALTRVPLERPGVAVHAPPPDAPPPDAPPPDAPPPDAPRATAPRAADRALRDRSVADAPARRDRALATMGRTPHRVGIPLALAILVLAAAGASAYLVARGRTGHAAAGHRNGAQATHHHRRASQPVKKRPTEYLAVQSTSSSATYAPATASYSLVIGATSGDCWFSVTTSGGATVLAQTFAAGASATLSLSGTSTLDIGAPTAATLSIGKVPVVLPRGVVGPFTVTLAPR